MSDGAIHFNQGLTIFNHIKAQIKIVETRLKAVLCKLVEDIIFIRNMHSLNLDLLLLLLLRVREAFCLDVGHIVGPLNYSRCDTKHRLPCTITPFLLML